APRADAGARTVDQSAHLSLGGPPLTPHPVRPLDAEGRDPHRFGAQAPHGRDEPSAALLALAHLPALHVKAGVASLELGDERLGVLAVRAADAPKKPQRERAGGRLRRSRRGAVRWPLDLEQACARVGALWWGGEHRPLRRDQEHQSERRPVANPYRQSHGGEPSASAAPIVVPAGISRAPAALAEARCCHPQNIVTHRTRSDEAAVTTAT